MQVIGDQVLRGACDENMCLCGVDFNRRETPMLWKKERVIEARAVKSNENIGAGHNVDLEKEWGWNEKERKKRGNSL